MRDELIGKTVMARVTRVETYGVYLKFDGLDVLVLIPDVSHERISDLHSLYAVGDAVPVKIFRYVSEVGAFKGTIKDA